MAQAQLQRTLQHLRLLVAARPAGHVPDRELLERFVRDRDEAAFAALVKRHGAMVLGVCRRVLRHAQDAEDACQATFLVLARKAAAVRKPEAVGSWLYGVAYRLAGKVRATEARRRTREGPLVEVPSEDPAAEVTWREVRLVLDQELARLPERYRAPLVLCYLEGQTRDEAAQQLGWTPGTLRGRLERGRELLRRRLTGRGLDLSAALLSCGLVPHTGSAAVPSSLAASTTAAALLVATGQPTAGVVAPQVAALAAEAVRASWLVKLKLAAAVLLAGSVLGGGGWFSYHGQAPGTAEARQVNAPRPAGGRRADPPPAPAADEVRRVLDRYRAARPEDKDLAIYQLDWVPTLQDAREKAAREQRPILLLVVTNSYGNLYTGHC